MSDFSFAKFNFMELTSKFEVIKSRLGEPDKSMVDIVNDLLLTIQRNPKHWDDKCTFTKKKYAKHFLNSISYIDSNDFRGAFKGIILNVYAFYEECRYWTDDHLFSITDFGIDLSRLLAAINSSDIYNSLNPELDAIKDEVYRETVRCKVNDDAFEKIFNEVNSRENLLKEVSDLSAYIDSKTQLVEALDEKISTLRTEYNFIGLYQGFQNVFRKKEIARKDALKFTYALGSTLISVPFLIITLMIVSQYVYVQDLEKSLVILKFLALPVVSVEIFLLYYFRLKYSEVKSFDAQMLQLEHRMALCQFVEAYSKFAADIHKESPDLLSSFEALIFSPIVAKDSDIPPLIDGANQLVDLIKGRK